jgi:hypothetical protein
MNLFSDVIRIFANVSWSADISAVLVFMIISGIWYSPLVFGKTWRNLVGLTKEQFQKRALASLLWNTPITFLIAANIAAFCKHFDYDTAVQGMLIGYDLGLIICLFLAIQYIYEQRPLKLYGISAGHVLLSMTFMGMAIGSLI